MATDPRYALYYPTIEFQDPAWLWSAALLWDGIYRIVPEGYCESPSRNVARLLADDDIGRVIRPEQYTLRTGREFLQNIQGDQWQASALAADPGSPEYRLIHREKVDVAIREMLIAANPNAETGNWLRVPPHFAALYMTYLARHIATANNLQLVSDSLPGFTASTYFQFDGQVDPEARFHGAILPHHLAYLVMEDFLPSDPLSIRPEDILAFRREHSDERRNFLQSMEKAAARISKCEDPAVIADLVHDVKADIDRALTEYRSAAQMLKIKSWTGLQALSVPIASTLISRLAQLSPAMTTFIANSGIALGVWYGWQTFKAGKRKLSLQSDYSYLVHLKDRFPDQPTFVGNLSYSMNEFVVD